MHPVLFFEEKVCTQVKNYAPSIVFGGKSLYAGEKLCTQFCFGGKSLYAGEKVCTQFCFWRKKFVHM
jgi:hypothetical protein